LAWRQGNLGFRQWQCSKIVFPRRCTHNHNNAISLKMRSAFANWALPGPELDRDKL
jgi:hypothetical protein